MNATHRLLRHPTLCAVGATTALATAGLLSRRRGETSSFLVAEGKIDRVSAFAPTIGILNAAFQTTVAHQWTTGCESAQPSRPESSTPTAASNGTAQSKNSGIAALPKTPSWIRRNVLAPAGILPLPVPRVLTPADPALKLPRWCVRQRQHDERRMRALVELAPTLRGDPERLKALGEEMFQVAYGKGVTPQIREDFLVRYGCTGWTQAILSRLVEFCDSRGIVEVGAGHGQWARALSEAYDQRGDDGAPNTRTRTGRRHFDFVLAYDDNSNLPLNTHIYNQFTQPHHDYFGNVKIVEGRKMTALLQSWACRGRTLLLVYPPPGPMALEVVQTYINSAPENDTVVYVGEGRGGANADAAFFDQVENGEWILVEVMEVLRPPGDKGYEKLYVLQKKRL
jgi:hypothetical protein